MQTHILLPANNTCGSNGAAEKPPENIQNSSVAAYAIGVWEIGRAESGTFSSHLLRFRDSVAGTRSGVQSWQHRGTWAHINREDSSLCCRDKDFPVGVKLSPAKRMWAFKRGNVEGGSTLNNGHRSVLVLSALQGLERTSSPSKLGGGCVDCRICCRPRCPNCRYLIWVNAKFWVSLHFWNIGFGVLVCSLESASYGLLVESARHC